MITISNNKELEDLIIIRDSHEKLVWDFSFFGVQQVDKHLPTGDYSIAGMEDVITVDRKRTSGEVYANLVKQHDRFYREMERMTHFKYKFIVTEFSLDSLLLFPKDSGIPTRYHKGLRGGAARITDQLELIKQRFGVLTLFCDSRDAARDKVFEMFKDVYEGREPNI